jgi:hypothetical protein
VLGILENVGRGGEDRHCPCTAPAWHLVPFVRLPAVKHDSLEVLKKVFGIPVVLALLCDAALPFCAPHHKLRDADLPVGACAYDISVHSLELRVSEGVIALHVVQ